MATTAAERKAQERLKRQVTPWLYRQELEHAVGVAAGRALAHGDAITRAKLVERTVNLLIESSKDATGKLLRAGHVCHEDLPPVETMRDEAADCLRRHFVTVTAEEDARRREFDDALAATQAR